MHRSIQVIVLTLILGKSSLCASDTNRHTLVEEIIKAGLNKDCATLVLAYAQTPTYGVQKLRYSERRMKNWLEGFARGPNDWYFCSTPINCTPVIQVTEEQGGSICITHTFPYAAPMQGPPDPWGRSYAKFPLERKLLYGDPGTPSMRLVESCYRIPKKFPKPVLTQAAEPFLFFESDPSSGRSSLPLSTQIEEQTTTTSQLRELFGEEVIPNNQSGVAALLTKKLVVVDKSTIYLYRLCPPKAKTTRKATTCGLGDFLCYAVDSAFR
jgi:hypothetical protein